MKKTLVLFFALCTIITLLLTSCANDPDIEKAENYSIGDTVILANKEYNVYNIKSGKILLLAKQKIGNSTYGEINNLLDSFKHELQDAEIKFEHVGLLEYEDLDDLGGNKHTVSISGLPYLCDDAPAFVHFEEGYWLDGYSEYDSYTWLYEQKRILQIQYNDSTYAIRPVVHIMATDIPD